MKSSQSTGEVLKKLLQIRSLPRRESELAGLLSQELNVLGLAVKRDGASKKIGGDADNILARVDPSAEGGTLLLAHMDNIASSPENLPAHQDGYLYNRSQGAFGVDDMAGISLILSLLHGRQKKLPPNLGVAFTVAEELGLLGAAVLPGEFVRKFDSVLVLDGEAPAGTIYHSEPAAGFFALTLSHSSPGSKLTSRQKMLLRRIRHCWVKSEDSPVSQLISGPLPAWRMLQEEILIVGIRGSDVQAIKRRWQKRLKEIKRYFGIRGEDISHKILHTCSGFSLDASSGWLYDLIQAFRQSALEVDLCSSDNISEADRINEMGVEAVNLGLGLSAAHTDRERIDLSSLQRLADVLERYLLS